LLVGQEHGRTIPLTDIGSEGAISERTIAASSQTFVTASSKTSDDGPLLLFNFYLLMADRGENNGPRTGLSQTG
jgi:hypothetical protein